MVKLREKHLERTYFKIGSENSIEMMEKYHRNLNVITLHLTEHKEVHLICRNETTIRMPQRPFYIQVLSLLHFLGIEATEYNVVKLKSNLERHKRFSETVLSLLSTEILKYV